MNKMKNNMQSFLILAAMSFWFISGFCLSQLLFPPIIDTTPVPHVIKQQIYDKKAIFTAYNAIESQTDGSPCVGAGNHNICEISKWKRVCASRLYPLHTVISIDGIGECEILDRTSIKNGKKIDILMPTYEEAINFGKKELKYKVVN